MLEELENRDKHLIEQAITPTSSIREAHVGMPILAQRSRALAFFEFWPSSIVYLPIVVQWLFKAVRYRGLTLPLCANPGFYLGGLVGESKAENFRQAGDYARQFIAPWCRVVNDGVNSKRLLTKTLREMNIEGLSFPLIAKPDMGCRGRGVRIVRDRMELAEYLQQFPEKASVILQELIPWEPEAGIFYIRRPDEQKGRIFSLTLKYQPYVYGNGVDSLQTLIEQDPRAGKLAHLYLGRHRKYLNEVLEPGQPFRLAFTGSHSLGSIFRDGRDLITEELTEAFDRISRDIDGFYFGRFDVRFAHERSLRAGKDFRIVEINGISSEAGHIWDADSSLKEVYKTLFHQYDMLFEIGAINRKRGYKPESLIQVLQSWAKETRLVRRYPDAE